MSRENVETVRRGYEAVHALMRGELTSEGMDTWLSFHHPDVEVHDLPTMPDAPVRRGHDDLRKWIKMMRDTWAEGSYYEPEEITAAADFVLVAVRGHAWGRGSRVPIEVSFFSVFEMREGKIRRVSAYFDKRQALDAAGLRD